MKRKYRIALTVILIASILTLVGCSGSDPDTTSTETIKIGAFGPLTGELAAYGGAAINGANLAAEEINLARGIDGKQIEIVEYDTKADKTESINIYNRLRDQDEVVAMLGGTISGESLAVKELAIADNMPMLTPTATALEVTTDAPSIFRACYTDTYQGEAIAKFASENLEAKTAAIMYNTDDAYSEGLAQAFKNYFENKGLEITRVLGYTKNEVDFSAILTEIRQSNPDIIYLPDYYDKVGKIATQMRNMGIEQTAVGVDGWDSVEIDYAEQVEGYYFVNHFAKTDPDEQVQSFIKSYTDTYDKEPNALAALWYDSTYVMAEALEKAGSSDSNEIIDALNETEYKGVTGNIRFDEQGDVANKDIAIIRLEDGKNVLVDKIVVDD